MNQVSNDQIRHNVRTRYKEIALQPVDIVSCCSPSLIVANHLLIMVMFLSNLVILPRN